MESLRRCRAFGGAEEVQKAFGYRYYLKEVRYPRRIEPGQIFQIAFVLFGGVKVDIGIGH